MDARKSNLKEHCGNAIALIERGDLHEALDCLEPLVKVGETGEVHALMGLANFYLEAYAKAEACFEAALARGADYDWDAVREHARVNAEAEIQAPIPSVEYFDKDRLLAPLTLGDGALPTPPSTMKPSDFQRALNHIGNGLGCVLAWIAHVAVQGHGKMFGYRDELWTNWYRRDQVRAILTLSYMRDRLNKNNLIVTYPKGALTGFQAPGQVPPVGALYFRTANGSWNNLTDPMEGAAGTRFSRNVTSDAIRPETGERLMTPNPRKVSLKLLTRHGDMKKVPFLNLLAASWIQFQNHDWISHGENLTRPDVYEIPLEDDDPARTRYRQTKMFVGKTQPDPTRRNSGEPAPVTYLNEVTHWWDGSQIYGSDQATQSRLRSGIDGKLKLENGLLPLRSGVEDTGFTRNWWVGLSMLHTLFAKEHNAVCDRLKQKYPSWDDNRLFHVSRLVNAAVIAKIHTVEWTPAMLPNRDANRALNANWFGLATHLFRRRKHRKACATLNIRHPEMGGVVGNPIDKHGSEYGLTEEFVEVYRLHSLLPETLTLRRHQTGVIIEEIPLAQTRQAGSPKITRDVSMTDLFYSFGNQHPGALVLNNYPEFLQKLSIPGNPVFDLGAVDILRARERGVPRYNEFRRQLGLNGICRFEDLTNDEDKLESLKEVYGDGPGAIDDLDLLIGTLAEDPENPPVRPTGFGFGETLFQIFILNATRRLQADRFYTDYYNEEIYTREGLDWIDDSDLKTVLLRHYPKLAGSGLANVSNAFEPWDHEPKLKSERHPLRRYDRELQPDPWIGDAYR